MDYEASVAFYKALGLGQIVNSPPCYARFETPGGETFSIHLVDEVRSTTIVYFEVEDVDAFVSALGLPRTQGAGGPALALARGAAEGPLGK
jgi:hydroxymethylpyrimidine/phosphomethylpyrimidine kinase